MSSLEFDKDGKIIVPKAPEKFNPKLIKIDYLSANGGNDEQACIFDNGIYFIVDSLKDILDFLGGKISNAFISEEGYLCSKNSSGEKYFHRFIVGEQLKEKMSTNPDEVWVVHHKNFNRQDNRRSNLMILTKEQHDSIHGRKQV
jgi:hypothetical protein